MHGYKRIATLKAKEADLIIKSRDSFYVLLLDRLSQVYLTIMNKDWDNLSYNLFSAENLLGKTILRIENKSSGIPQLKSEVRSLLANLALYPDLEVSGQCEIKTSLHQLLLSLINLQASFMDERDELNYSSVQLKVPASDDVSPKFILGKGSAKSFPDRSDQSYFREFQSFWHVYESTLHALDGNLRELSIEIPQTKLTLDKLYQSLSSDTPSSPALLELQEFVDQLKHKRLSEKKMIAIFSRTALQLFQTGHNSEALCFLNDAKLLLDKRLMALSRIHTFLYEVQWKEIQHKWNKGLLLSTRKHVNSLRFALEDITQLYTGRLLIDEAELQAVKNKALEHIRYFENSIWTKEPQLFNLKLLIARMKASITALSSSYYESQPQFRVLAHAHNRLLDTQADLAILFDLTKLFVDDYVSQMHAHDRRSLRSPNNVSVDKAKRQAFALQLSHYNRAHSLSADSTDPLSRKRFFKHFAQLYQAVFMSTGVGNPSTERQFQASQVLFHIIDSNNIKRLLLDISELKHTSAFVEKLSNLAGNPTYSSLTAIDRKELLTALSLDFELEDRLKHDLFAMGQTK